MISGMENSYIGTIIDGLRPSAAASRRHCSSRQSRMARWRGKPVRCFPAPETRSSYFTFNAAYLLHRAGFGEDKPATRLTYHYTGDNIDDQAFREEAAVWRRLWRARHSSRQSGALRCATRRSTPSREYCTIIWLICQDLFKKDKPENRIHLWLSGHTRVLQGHSG